MNKTKIETAEYTWNPMTGCDQICFEGDCYAYQMIKRFGSKWGYDWTPRIHMDRLSEPEELSTPSLIFVPSMGDLMTPSLNMDDVWYIFIYGRSDLLSHSFISLFGGISVMQAWELERELGKAQDKLKAVKSWFNDWINPWLDKAGEEGFMLPKKRMTSLKKILEDRSSGESPT